MSKPENVASPTNCTTAELFRQAITAIWFPAEIKSFESIRKTSSLRPEAALCLLIMVTEGVSSGAQIEMHLHGYGGGGFARKEAKILSEWALFSLESNGYIRLDAKGKVERELNDDGNYGLGDIQWLLTAKGARAMATAYCACKGLPTSEEKAAVKAMLAENKAAVASNRKRLKQG